MPISMSVSNAQIWPYFGLIGVLGGMLVSQHATIVILKSTQPYACYGMQRYLYYRLNNVLVIPTLIHLQWY